jgi:hypothetical protein
LFFAPRWLMENSIWTVAPAAENGVFPSFLQPLNKPVPVVATADIGRVSRLRGSHHFLRYEDGTVVPLHSGQTLRPIRNAISCTYTYSGTIGLPSALGPILFHVVAHALLRAAFTLV